MSRKQHNDRLLIAMQTIPTRLLAFSLIVICATTSRAQEQGEPTNAAEAAAKKASAAAVLDAG